MTDITCQMCMDLMPLVRDGIASDDSCGAVHRHLHTCPNCRGLFEGELPPPKDGIALMTQLRRQLRIFSAMLLMFGIFFGLSLTASSELFYNALIMPVIGAVGYYIFRWKALYTVPALLLITHLLTNGLSLLRGVEHLDILTLLMWTVLYCLFAAVGMVIAGLLHFALRKER